MQPLIVDQFGGRLSVSHWRLKLDSGLNGVMGEWEPRQFPYDSVVFLTHSGNVSIGGSPYTIAVNPNASRIYVAGDSNILTVVDAVSHAVVARVTLPSASNSGIAIDYKSGTVYVLVQGGIAVINGTSNEVVGEIPINFGYRSIAFDSSTGTIYGSAETLGNSSLVGVDSHTGKVTANVSIGYWASDVLVNPHLNLIYAIGCAQSFVCDSMISVVNGTSAKLMNETALGSAYYSTATIDEKTGLVYVSGEAQLAILNPYGTVIYNNYPDTCGPFIGMTDDPTLNQVIVAPQNYNFILVYNGWFGNLMNMYSLPDSPQCVAFNPATNETYVVVSASLLTFKSVASVGHVNDTLIGAGQFCLPV
jgi:DNA-binding beta-propeller fold protein YncE